MLHRFGRRLGLAEVEAGDRLFACPKLRRAAAGDVFLRPEPSTVNVGINWPQWGLLLALTVVDGHSEIVDLL